MASILNLQLDQGTTFSKQITVYGTDGTTVENLTGAYISVYGKTVGIIGEVNDVYLAHQAVSMLLQGSMHRTVYKFLEKKQQESHLGITEEMKHKW